MEEINHMQLEDLRHTYTVNHANFVLQKTWPGAAGETADWPGLSALLVIIRHLYSMMPVYSRVSEDTLKRETANPILKLAWMNISRELEPEYRQLWQTIRNRLCPGPGESLLTLWELFNSDLMVTSMWSADEFLLYDPGLLAMPASTKEGGEWQRQEPYPIEEVARHGIVEYDGSEELSDVLSNMFGAFADKSGNLFLRLFSQPIYLRVLYKPTSAENVPIPEFDKLQTICFETQQWRRDNGNQWRLLLQKHWYSLVVTARLRPDEAEKDFVRLYAPNGGYIYPPESLQGSSILSSSWRVGMPEQSYLLIYVKMDLQLETQQKDFQEVEHINARIEEYQRGIDFLGDLTFPSPDPEPMPADPLSSPIMPVRPLQDLPNTSINEGEREEAVAEPAKIAEKLSSNSIKDGAWDHSSMVEDAGFGQPGFDQPQFSQTRLGQTSTEATAATLQPRPRPGPGTFPSRSTMISSGQIYHTPRRAVNKRLEATTEPPSDKSASPYLSAGSATYNAIPRIPTAPSETSEVDNHTLLESRHPGGLFGTSFSESNPERHVDPNKPFLSNTMGAQRLPFELMGSTPDEVGDIEKGVEREEEHYVFQPEPVPGGPQHQPQHHP